LFPQVAKKFFEDKLKAKTAAQKDESNISNIGKESDGDKKNKEEVHYITVTM
jgi:hypothetical protein